jgi:hypothetical protein
MSIFSGMLLLARFRPEGFQAFGATPQSVLNSLAPLLGFPLAGTLLGLLSGEGIGALTDFLVVVVALLTPLVISHALAGAWGRGAAWPRFATASNWCQWTVPLLGVVVVIAATLLDRAGLPMRAVLGTAFVVLFLYGLGLQWFLARAGLDLSRGRAALLVLSTMLGTMLLVVIPQLLLRPAP